MKIVMISRDTLYSSPGGDTIQIINTAKYLKRIGIKVDIKLTSDPINYSQYDLIHFFNIIRPDDCLMHLKKSALPFVISTIFVDYSEYERKARTGILKLLSYIFSSDQIEYLKAIARIIKRKEKLKSWLFIWYGQKKSIQTLLQQASMLLPNSKNEYERLYKHYQISQKFIIIPNAIDLEIFSQNRTNPYYDKFKNSIICVARIEGLKNQLNLIKAVNKTNHKLFIIGQKASNQSKYYKKCLEEASKNPNIEFIDHLTQEELASIMKMAKIHALVSWFETTGLVSLEAAFAGCNIIISDKGDQREYFQNAATYCNPENINDIINAIDIAYNKPIDAVFIEKIQKEYNWEKTAEKTFNAYNEILGNKK